MSHTPSFHPADQMTDIELEDALARASAKHTRRAPHPKPDPEWAKLRIVWPNTKIPISLRLDEQIVEWFRSGGPGYQTRINAVLRAFVEAQCKIV